MIPARNRPQQLEACLAGLAQQTLDTGRFEVVVVDDGSAVPLAPSAPPALEVIVVRQPHAGVAAARNAGVAHARGPVLAFTDDDCVPGARWLETLLTSVAADPGSLHAGRVESAPGVGLLAQASQELITFLVEHDNDATDTCFLTGNNLAVTRAVFETLGGFDARRMPLAAGEERELAERALRQGTRLRLVLAARVLHHNSMSLGGFLRLHHRYGRGARLLHRSRPAPRRALPTRPVRFYAALLASPLRRAPMPSSLALSGLIAISQAAHAAGYATELAAPTR